MVRYGAFGPKIPVGSKAFKERLEEIYGEGVDHVSKIPWMREKIIKSMVDNIGYDGDINYIHAPMQIPEIKKKIEDTNLEKLGVKYPFQSDEIQNKGEETKLEKYGDKHYSNHEKADKTFRENHNGMSFAEYGGSEECLKKISDKFEDKYGNAEFFKSKYFIDLMLKNYGTLHITHKYNCYNTYFDSSWELAVWIYCIDHNIPIIRNPCKFEYIYDNKTFYYEPDFMINNQLVEIKGDHYFKEDGTMYYPYTKLHHDSKEFTEQEKEYWNGIYEAKHQCGLQNNVLFWTKKDIQQYIDYCNTIYPNWDIIYRKDNIYNPSYWVYYINNTYIPNYYNNSNYIKGIGISPYDIDSNDEYTVYKDSKGISPWDRNKEENN